MVDRLSPNYVAQAAADVPSAPKDPNATGPTTVQKVSAEVANVRADLAAVKVEAAKTLDRVNRAHDRITGFFGRLHVEEQLSVAFIKAHRVTMIAAAFTTVAVIFLIVHSLHAL